MYDFNYLIEKIKLADFSESPFKHIYLDSFFSDDHFKEIISSEEIEAPSADNDEDLIEGLYDKGFKVIPFPGCITDHKEYIAWHNGAESKHHSACEGFGLALRLYGPKSPILVAVNEFLESDEFNNVIASKFGVDINQCHVDGGIQKYLDGYEISPHADIRKKAATFMVNINPSSLSESLDHHTRYLKFKPEREYVQTLWAGNPSVDRSWVPWDWAEVEFQQTKNNSIVLFSPSDDTLHGVKADYDHLKTQRTQLYGNIWYNESSTSFKPEWEDLDLSTKKFEAAKKGFKEVLVGSLPAPAKKHLKNVLGAFKKPSKEIGKRNT